MTDLLWPTAPRRAKGQRPEVRQWCSPAERAELIQTEGMDADRHERARQVMVSLDMDQDWLATLDPASPEWVVEWQRGTVDAYSAGDLDWLLERTDPEIEIVQPPEIPGGSSYRGHEGLIDALLDWPLEWEDFSLEPKRIFALDDSRAVVVAVHCGRSRRMEIEVEAEIVWLFSFEGERVRRWDMFMSLDAALEAAGSS